MLEVKKLRTLQRKGNEMEKNKVLEKTRKYLVSGPAIKPEPLLMPASHHGAIILVQVVIIIC